MLYPVSLILYPLNFVHKHYISAGIPIRYGAPEPWKAKAVAIGRTKPSRAPKLDDKKRKKNDGRPPDTIKDLLLNTATKKATKSTQKITKAPKLGPAAYQWSTNSCWLDASLQVLYIIVTKHYNEFNGIFQHLKEDCGLRALYEAVNARVDLDLDDENVYDTLMSQRDQLRIFLHKKAVIEELDRPESAVVSRNKSRMYKRSFFH